MFDRNTILQWIPSNKKDFVWLIAGICFGWALHSNLVSTQIDNAYSETERYKKIFESTDSENSRLVSENAELKQKIDVEVQKSIEVSEELGKLKKSLIKSIKPCLSEAASTGSEIILCYLFENETSQGAEINAMADALGLPFAQVQFYLDSLRVEKKAGYNERKAWLTPKGREYWMQHKRKK